MSTPLFFNHVQKLGEGKAGTQTRGGSWRLDGGNGHDVVRIGSLLGDLGDHYHVKLGSTVKAAVSHRTPN